MSEKSIKAGLIGFGVVGTGVVRLFNDSAKIINAKAGVKTELVKICDLDIETDRNVSTAGYKLTKNADDILEDPEIDIVIELIGGYKLAFDFVIKAMKNGKHVVTANKALLSKYWDEIVRTAKENNVNIMGEAAVAGGIPILRALNHGLAANRIEKIIGILNGTCNYILTKMSVDKMEFEDALQQAQELGFAETDPTLDIEGFDTMHKIVILSTLAFGKRVKEDQVSVEGITGIDIDDIKTALSLGYKMKLLAIAEKKEGIANVRVHPALVYRDRQLASVNNEFNAVYIKGDAVGDTLFYGKGAGEMPTASAVLSDVIFIARSAEQGLKAGRFAEKETEMEYIPIDEIHSKYYLRFNVQDKSGVLSEISGILGRNNISIETVMQKARHTTERVPVIIMTYESREADVKKALAEIDALEITKEDTVLYRVVD